MAMGRKRRGARGKPGTASPLAGGLAAEVERLRRELAEAKSRPEEMMREGADAFTRRRLAELESARQIARGQALDAAADRARAEARFRALRDAIGKAPGWRGT